MTPSQLERCWRRLEFRRQHYRNLASWAKTDWERDAAAAEARRCTWELIDLSGRRNELYWEDFWAARRLND